MRRRESILEEKFRGFDCARQADRVLIYDSFCFAWTEESLPLHGFVLSLQKLIECNKRS